jgi:hypothetical protein
VQAFADTAAGRISGEDGLAQLRGIAPAAEFSNGFLFGDCGAAPLPRARESVETAGP